MSNRIGPIDSGAASGINKKPGKSGLTGVAAGSAGGSGGAGSVGDRVELTGRGRIVAEASEMLAAIAPVDNARVAEVRLAIENGEYVIDADSIADALLRSDLELAG